MYVNVQFVSKASLLGKMASVRIVADIYRKGVGSMGADEWGVPTLPCRCVLVTKYKELQDAINSNCIDCKEKHKMGKLAHGSEWPGEGIPQCDRCVFFKLS